ncbi:MAG: hypothetical protein AAB553_00845 [Patescibacteria group bacterium]
MNRREFLLGIGAVATGAGLVVGGREVLFGDKKPETPESLRRKEFESFRAILRQHTHAENFLPPYFLEAPTDRELVGSFTVRRREHPELTETVYELSVPDSVPPVDHPMVNGIADEKTPALRVVYSAIKPGYNITDMTIIEGCFTTSSDTPTRLIDTDPRGQFARYASRLDTGLSEASMKDLLRKFSTHPGFQDENHWVRSSHGIENTNVSIAEVSKFAEGDSLFQVQGRADQMGNVRLEITNKTQDPALGIYRA